jgi:hypothetical protein
MSPDLQPPLPLQLFFPLQSCLLIGGAKDALPDRFAGRMPNAIVLPAINPAIAGEVIDVPVVAFISLTFTLFVL